MVVESRSLGSGTTLPNHISFADDRRSTLLIQRSRTLSSLNFGPKHFPVADRMRIRLIEVQLDLTWRLIIFVATKATQLISLVNLVDSADFLHLWQRCRVCLNIAYRSIIISRWAMQTCLMSCVILCCSMFHLASIIEWYICVPSSLWVADER